MSLAEKQCTPCQGGVEPMGREQAESYLKQVPQWSLDDSGTKIRREFKFKNFVQANEFVDKVGELAEEEQHHPDIQFGYGYAVVEIHTHKIGGLHENDFILAAKIDGAADKG